MARSVSSFGSSTLLALLAVLAVCTQTGIGWDAPTQVAGSHTVEAPDSAGPDTHAARPTALLEGAEQLRTPRDPQRTPQRGTGWTGAHGLIAHGKFGADTRAAGRQTFAPGARRMTDARAAISAFRHQGRAPAESDAA